ncbi:MAG: hypothetical protein PWP08_813 [Methanofollis sp.]|nr:hypothetical protein [Methanofollis sp.]
MKSIVIREYPVAVFARPARGTPRTSLWIFFLVREDARMTHALAWSMPAAETSLRTVLMHRAPLMPTFPLRGPARIPFG